MQCRVLNETGVIRLILEIPQLTNLIQIQALLLISSEMFSQLPNCYESHFLLPQNVNNHNSNCIEFGEGLDDII